MTLKPRLFYTDADNFKNDFVPSSPSEPICYCLNITFYYMGQI